MRSLTFCLACLMSASCATTTPAARSASQGVAQDDQARFAGALVTKPLEKDKGCVGRHFMLPTGFTPERGFSVTFVVKFLVKSDGTVERFERLTGLSEGQAPQETVRRFDDRLWGAIRSCAFEPGRDAKGIPQNIWMILPIHFSRP